jgi:hypothetical protein
MVPLLSGICFGIVVADCSPEDAEAVDDSGDALIWDSAPEPSMKAP